MVVTMGHMIFALGFFSVLGFFYVLGGLYALYRKCTGSENGGIGAVFELFFYAASTVLAPVVCILAWYWSF